MLAIKFVETSLQPIGEPIRRNVGSVERRAASCAQKRGFGVMFSLLAGALLIGAAT
jgi:hypothetical protein